jgi:hypothetical protein
MPTITFELDEKDSAVLHAEIARRQARSRFPGGGTILPEGESCIAGALLAEAIRDLDEYRSIHEAKNTRDSGALTRLILVSPETSRPLRISAPVLEVDGAAVLKLANRIEEWQCTIKMEEL